MIINRTRAIRTVLFVCFLYWKQTPAAPQPTVGHRDWVGRKPRSRDKPSGERVRSRYRARGTYLSRTAVQSSYFLPVATIVLYTCSTYVAFRKPTAPATVARTIVMVQTTFTFPPFSLVLARSYSHPLFLFPSQSLSLSLFLLLALNLYFSLCSGDLSAGPRLPHHRVRARYYVVR